MFQIGHVSLTSADTYRRDSHCLARVFQNLPAPPKQYGVFDVFRDFQSFFQLENLGSHLAMCPDDRFLPQGKQILPEICQVRPMPYTNTVFFHAVASSVNEKPVAKIRQVTQAHYLCHVRVSYNMRTYGAKFRSGNVLENGNENR